jgi:hypothetical protein
LPLLWLLIVVMKTKLAKSNLTTARNHYRCRLVASAAAAAAAAATIDRAWASWMLLALRIHHQKLMVLPMMTMMMQRQD